ncbi:MAG: hypothetical protein ABIJ56_07010 [Pseudomonadota bacterium]
MKNTNPGLVLLPIIPLFFALLPFGCKTTNRPAKSKDPTPEQREELKSASLKILPESFRDIWLGISEEEFQKARSTATFQPAKTDPDERKWYKELDKTGVNVWYAIERETGSLVVIQFANSLPTWRVFQQHSMVTVQNYGTDYELYLCPTTDYQFKMTRLLWPKKPVSVMEAILEGKGVLSVTMIVSTLEDSRKAIERQRCNRVDKEEALEQWIQDNLQKEQKEAPVPHALPDPDKKPGECGMDKGYDQPKP